MCLSTLSFSIYLKAHYELGHPCLYYRSIHVPKSLINLDTLKRILRNSYLKVFKQLLHDSLKFLILVPKSSFSVAKILRLGALNLY